MDIFKKRRAVRSYRPKPVEWKKMKKILMAGFYSPSGFDKHPLDFVVVRDKGTKNRLSFSNKWTYFADRADTLIVVCADFKKSEVWLEDASIAAGYMWLKAAELGIGACWEHVLDSVRKNGQSGEEYVREILSIPEYLKVVCFLSIGYPEKKIPAHSEKEFYGNKIHIEKW